MSSSEKFSFVQSWLQSIYGEDGVPEYEVDSQTIDALYEIANASQRNTSNALLVLEDTNTQIESLKSKSSHLSSLVSSCGLLGIKGSVKSNGPSFVGFDDPQKQILAELVRLTVSLSLSLDLTTTNASSVMEALGDLDMELFSIETDTLSLAERKAQLTATYKETAELRQFLQRVASTWDQQLQASSPDHEERLSNLKYLDNKTREYSANLVSLKDTLKKNGAQPSLYHGTLQQLHDQLEQLETQNQGKQAQLEGFKQLPPDAALASLKIEEAAAHLAQLEEQISRKVNQLQLHSDV